MSDKSQKSNVPRFIVAAILSIVVAIMWVNNKNKAEEREQRQNSSVIIPER